MNLSCPEGKTKTVESRLIRKLNKSIEKICNNNCVHCESEGKADQVHFFDLFEKLLTLHVYLPLYFINREIIINQK